MRIEKTDNTPEIELTETTPVMLTISGMSAPEFATEWYKPVINKLETLNADITVNFKLYYYNTPTSKVIIKILYTLEVISKKGKNVVINWFYDDEDILESGKDFQLMTTLKINLVANK